MTLRKERRQVEDQVLEHADRLIERLNAAVEHLTVMLIDGPTTPKEPDDTEA